MRKVRVNIPAHYSHIHILEIEPLPKPPLSTCLKAVGEKTYQFIAMLRAFDDIHNYQQVPPPPPKE